MGCVISKQGRRERRQDACQYLRTFSTHHIISLTSSTLGSLRFSASVDADNARAWSEMMEPRVVKTQSPETINAWELMAGLEDPTPLPAPRAAIVIRRSFSFNNVSDREIPNLTGIVKARIAAFQQTIDARRATSTGRRSRLGNEVKVVPSLYPPGGEGKVVLYFTSLRGVRETYEDCWAVRVLLHGYSVRVDERDVSLHGGFREELRELLGVAGGLPRVFAGGRCLGGLEGVRMMHERGELGKVMEGCEVVKVGKDGVLEQCEGCGGVRFVPCETCSGSCKVFVEEEEGGGGFRRCPECNENGLVRCPLCC